MLWSLLKIVFFICLIGLATWGAGMLLETDGGIRVAIGTVELNLGPLQALIAFVAVIVGVWLLLKVLSFLYAVFRFMSFDETALTRWWHKRSERKGYDALSEGMLALASGEGRVAMNKAAKAERYLGKPELTNLLTAQAAEMSGDNRRAEEVYRTLLADDRTRFVGVRGLMRQKLAEGDTEKAMLLAEKAFALKPRHEETQDVLLKLQTEKGDWTAARETLSAKLRYGALPKNVHRRRDAVLALGAAKSIVEHGKSIEARETAIEANKLSPDLVPAAVMAAKSYEEQNQKRLATRVLSKAWGGQPHPDLAAAFAALEPDESPSQRLRRFTALTKQHPDHPETRMLMAELKIADEDFPGARRAIGDLAETDPTPRALTIMAAIARGEGADDSEVRGLLARALNAPRGPQWVCENCHNIPGHWVPVCPNCGAFDTLSWTRPPKGEDAVPPGGAMLPLIVGQPAQPVAEPVEADAALGDVPEKPPAEAEQIEIPDGMTPAGGDTAKPDDEGVTKH